MRNLLKIFFIVFVFLGCANNNTSVNNIVKYKGTYTGNDITYNGSAIYAVAAITVEESGKVTLEIRRDNETLNFYADADFIKELSSTKFEVNSLGQYLSLDFSNGLYFIFNQGKGNYSGNLTKQ
ncbi:hypothetical protein [Brachyspira pilosicoli]|uniref:hypothetical protein n=1 Tax=Brachyspira pilosicoli TaxID=52584 RepID=UPI000C77513F|nr:hypothetical protein [Brachyspira pilosicoli]PLV56521.1 hypothetical protein BPSP16_10265 [Brachyspira pilosicoli SP16]